MAREFITKPYFNHSTYSNVYYTAQMVVERFLANILFKNDLTRVVWASDAYAYRKRFELVAQSDKAMFEGSFRADQLDFPFLNYFYSGGNFWTPDDRVATQQAFQMKRGMMAAGLPDYLRILPVKTELTATAHFQRDDDARLAYEMLMWEMMPKGSILLSVTINWRDVPILLPVFITVEDLQFNPQFNETDWLKSQRIHPLKFKMSLRTYTLDYPIQEALTGTRRAPFLTGRAEDYTSKGVYLTEEVVLNFLADKGFGELPDEEAFEEIAEVEGIDLLEETTATPEELDSTIDDVQSIVVDIMKGYFDTGELASNLPDVSITDVWQDQFSLTISYDPSVIPLECYKVLIPGRPVVTLENHVTRYQVTGLYPSSEYQVSFIFYFKDGTSRTYQTTVTTDKDEENLVDTPVSKKLGRLKGYTW
jgi:hypothetical protein